MKPFIPPPLPPEIDWEDLVPEISEANAQLARYDGLLAGLIHPDLLIAPLKTREAILSSKIEGTRATLDDILEHEAAPRPASDARTADVREVLNYRAAIQMAIQELETRPLSLNLIRDIHGALMEGVRGHHRARGDFRRVQNFIGPPGAAMEQATYVPPSPDQLMPLLDNLERYMHQNEKDALVQIGLVHAQFEMIHPFLDGNGRVGRILIPLFLFIKKRIERPAFYLSSYLEAHRESYYHYLKQASSEDGIQEWLRFFLTAVAQQAREDSRRIRKMSDLYEQTKQALVATSRSPKNLAILDALFARPKFTVRQLGSEISAAPTTIHRLLTSLQESGVLQIARPGAGQRPTLWSFPALLEILR